MATSNPRSTAQIAGHPIHPMLVGFPISFLVATLACDLAFWLTENQAFATASLWVLGAAIVMALLAAIAGFTDFLGEPKIRDLNDAWLHMIGNVVVVGLSLINFYFRYRQGLATILPWGIGISFVVVLLLLFNGWKGWEMVYRHRGGVGDDGAEREGPAASGDATRRG